MATNDHAGDFLSSGHFQYRCSLAYGFEEGQTDMADEQERCEFCGGNFGGIETQDMGVGRSMHLCGDCRGYIRHGQLRDTRQPQHGQHAALLTTAEIEAIRARVDNATPGPWQVDLGFERRRPSGAKVMLPAIASASGDLIIALSHGPEYRHLQRSEIEFIAASRTDIPRLLATLDAYRTIVERVADEQMDSFDECPFCGRVGPAHVLRCTVTRARALLDTTADYAPRPEED